MIRSYRDRDTEALHGGRRVRRFGSFRIQAIKRLDRIAAAQSLRDLAALPGNRLESLSGNRKGQYSIRINDQWRVCFRWTEHGAEDVEIVDYH